MVKCDAFKWLAFTYSDIKRTKAKSNEKAGHRVFVFLLR